jgi:hypothetical protein
VGGAGCVAGSGSSRCCRRGNGASAIRGASRWMTGRVLQGSLFVLHTGIGWEPSAAEVRLWLRDDGLAAAAGMAVGRRLGEVAPATTRRVARRRPARVGAGNRRLEPPAKEGSKTVRGFKMPVHAAARWYSWISPPSRSRRLISPSLGGGSAFVESGERSARPR